MTEGKTTDPRVYFAEERTFLAWIRTGLALMGFGFVVARFGIFLKQLALNPAQTSAHSTGLSLWLGVSMVATGVAVDLAAAWRHVLLVRSLRNGQGVAIRPSVLGIGLALILALVGSLMAFYLLRTPGVAPDAHLKGDPMQTTDDAGIVSRPSAHSVDETVARIQALLEQRHIQLFALVDHSGEAAKVGLTMPPTKLLIFGNPKAGTPVMLAAPSAAIDLPLKLLVWTDPAGKTWVSYNDPKHLQSRHHIPPDLLQNISAAQALAEQAAQ